jgi:hypothetical protein
MIRRRSFLSENL